MSEKFGIPIDQLRVGASQTYYHRLTNVAIRVGKIDNDKFGRVAPKDLRVWAVAVDHNRRMVDEEALQEAELAAYRAKYGKFSAGLWEILQELGTNDSFDVNIAIKGLDIEAIRREVQKKYPQLNFGYAPVPGRTRTAEEQKLWDEYDAEWKREVRKAGALLGEPLADFIRSKGFEARILAAVGAIDGKLPKWLILEIEKREDVAGIVPGAASPKGTGRVNLDTAAPSDAAPSVWQRGRTGEGKRIGIADVRGVSNQNPYLAPRAVYVEWPTPVPDQHPTNVAGIAASAHPKFRGMAYKSTILSSNIRDPGGPVWKQAVLDLINPGGAHVINISWGVDGDKDTLQPSAGFCDYLVRYYRLPVVVGAGNREYPLYNYVDSPGKGYNVMTVGGYKDVGHHRWKGDSMWENSSWRNVSSGHEKPEVVAVGEGIYTTSNQSPWITGTPMAGTSFAAPQVSGGIAALLQSNPALEGKPEAVKAILIASAVHNIQDGAGNDPAVDEYDGAGAINLDLGEYMAQYPKWYWNTIKLNDANHFDADGWYKFPSASAPEFPAPEGTRVRVAITWDSYVPGESGDNDVLKTDLDLYIYLLDGPGGNEIQVVAKGWA